MCNLVAAGGKIGQGKDKVQSVSNPFRRDFEGKALQHGASV
jgi:hypothetical protein